MQNNIGSRLREERERLGLSQQALGEIGGVKKLTQLNYEKGDRAPDTIYLTSVAEAGVDIVYVLTNGGPGHATEVLTTYAFQLYSRGQYGMSSALNSILLLITAIARSEEVV